MEYMWSLVLICIWQHQKLVLSHETILLSVGSWFAVVLFIEKHGFHMLKNYDSVCCKPIPIPVCMYCCLFNLFFIFGCTSSSLFFPWLHSLLLLAVVYKQAVVVFGAGGR